MIVRRFKRQMQAVLLCTSALALAAPAPAGAKTEPASQTSAAKVKKKKKSPAAPKAASGSAETTAERSQRLKRECKGRPNAGACLGFAS